MKALILAGGLGTLKSSGNEIISPMASIAGKPLLEHLFRFLSDSGIKDLILAVHHHADTIKSYFGNGSRFGVDITYSEEDIPLGTAGAIKRAERYLDDTFLVLNGDSYSQIDIANFLDFHQTKRSRCTIGLLLPHDALQQGNVLLEGSKVISFSEKKQLINGFISRGIYLLEPAILDIIEPEKKVSLEHDIFPILAKEGSLWGYPFEGHFMSIGQPETYQKFKDDLFHRLLLEPHHTVRNALHQINKSGINIILVANEQKKLLGVINETIARKYLLRGGNVDDTLEQAMVRDPIIARTSDHPDKITELLLSGINNLPVLDDEGRVASIEFHVEKIKRETYPVVRGRTPLRISFAGGGTDKQSFFEKHGGIVISATIDKYCYATLIKRADSKIIINSDIAEEIIFDSTKELIYDGKYDLIKAVINRMKPHFGFELYLHNDIPPGRGLGSSASISVLVISLLSYLQDYHYDDYAIAELAYRAEREELKIKGGWQDQYAAITGGFNFMEFSGEKTLIYPLRLKEEIVQELNHHLLLCYVGNPHASGEVHTHQETILASNEEILIKHLQDLKKIAIEVRDSLLTNKIEEIGSLLHQSWEHKRALDPAAISNTHIDTLYKIGLKHGVFGGKLLGAGGGGYILFFYSPRKYNQLVKALTKAGGEVMNFQFEFKGTQIWPARHKS